MPWKSHGPVPATKAQKQAAERKNAEVKKAIRDDELMQYRADEIRQIRNIEKGKR